MIIKTLVENTSPSKEYKGEHGLSLYIETGSHKLLFDVGASSLFIENAKKMGVNLLDVDFVIVSHGHYDHGGGLRDFLNLNKKATIYLKRQAFGKYYAINSEGEEKYIGLDENLLESERLIFVEDYFVLDKGLELFSRLKKQEQISTCNQGLFRLEDGLMVQDDFRHEQNLIISLGEKTILLTGCAHQGIINIVESLKTIKSQIPTYLVGGFHLHSNASKQDEDPVLIQQIGQYLKDLKSSCYTCHCTGLAPYKLLKEIMGGQLQYLATGSCLELR
jgi:7,8-dihydropterin-6-yl-methyl-4-(beta-D-ribofuranosyl)aminobenzene 5'-phosphate synthase